MAELVIIPRTVGPDPAYQNGDICCAFNDERILYVHACHICKLDSFLRQGLLERTYLHRFERVSLTEVRRVNTLTKEEDILSNIPNAEGERIHVQEFINRRTDNSQQFLFGSPGAEIWYNGPHRLTTSDISSVWDFIEANTANTRDKFNLWPLTSTEKKHFLALSVDNFSDEEAVDFTAPVRVDPLDSTSSTVAKRKHKVLWETLGILAPVLDKNVEKDIRDIPFSKDLIVQEKL